MSNRAKENADFNGDGKITEIDITIIMEIDAGSDIKLPAKNYAK